MKFQDSSEHFELFSEASGFCIGVILTQRSNLIGLFSKKLLNSQKKYSIVEREELEIIKGLKRFRRILEYLKITIYTDSANQLVIGNARNQ